MKNMKFSPYLIAVLVLGLFYSIVVNDLVSDFESLPSPLFGGDYYYQAGNIYHMYESSFLDWFKSGNMLGQLPGYLPFYGIVVTIFGKLFQLSPVEAMFDLNFFLPLLAVLFTFLFLEKLFSSGKIALLGTLFLVNFTSFPILKYTDFTSLILVPLFFYFLLLFYKDQTKNNALCLGVMFAVMGLAHSTSFVYATVMIFSLFLLILFEKYRKDKSKFKLNKECFNLLPFFGYSFVLGFLLSQIIWFEPIFVHQGSSDLGNAIWTTPDVKVFSLALDLFISHLKSMFFNFGNLLYLILSICSVLGLYFLIKNPFKSKETTFILFLFLISFLLIYSYFITSPLFDFHLVPGYMFSMYLSKISILVALFFIGEKILTTKYHSYILVILILLVMYGWYSSYDTWLSNEWFEVGHHPLPPMYADLQSYLLSNSNVNDVILSNNELSFGVNALSGRKLVTSRRSQNDPYMDFDQRQLDTAIILYGNDLNKKLGLLEKYEVKYLYYDVNWFGLEYHYDEQGQIIGYSDPIMLIYSEEKEQQLEENGIFYFKEYGWVDPAMRADNIRKYDLLLVSPHNYDFSGYGPWKSDLDPYLTPVWTHQENGQLIAALYEFSS